jgi:hypothetical protein
MEALLALGSGSDIKGSRIELTMYFVSGSVVAAANVLLVVALVVVALLVLPLIHDRAARLIMRRFRSAAGAFGGEVDPRWSIDRANTAARNLLTLFHYVFEISATLRRAFKMFRKEPKNVLRIQNGFRGTSCDRASLFAAPHRR